MIEITIRRADRGEVERGAEERAAADFLVGEHGEDETQNGLGGHDAEREPERVAQPRSEVAVTEDLPVVVEAHPRLFRRDHAPLVEAEPDNLENGPEDEQADEG